MNSYSFTGLEARSSRLETHSFMRVVPLVEELIPVPNAWEVAQTFSGSPHLLFLDSSQRHAERGRHSFICADPIRWLEISQFEYGQTDPFALLADLVAEYSSETIPGLPPFQGGLAGLFGYGLAHAIENLPRPRFDEFHVPDLAVGIYDWVIAFDHYQDRAWLISRDARRSIEVRRTLKSKTGDLGRFILDSTSNVSALDLAPRFPLPKRPEIASNFSRKAYLKTIGRTIEFIHAGDCFQANISQRLLASTKALPLDLYERLRRLNPAPFSAYFDLGDFAVASASPERFLRVENARVETRPIKGTRPRGQTAQEDAARIAELASSAKDRAENVMIVDLLRNDLGRVCEYGSVRVPMVCQVESFEFVHHLVSMVTGRLRANKSPFDLLRAAFPGGSVTGAPKVRAMEIIAELEPTARGPYCGSIGYVGFDGSMDTNILIRTYTIGKGWIQFPVGGGIVADSNPAQEYEETLHKAAGMLKALVR